MYAAMPIVAYRLQTKCANIDAGGNIDFCPLAKDIDIRCAIDRCCAFDMLRIRYAAHDMRCRAWEIIIAPTRQTKSRNLAEAHVPVYN